MTSVFRSPVALESVNDAVEQVLDGSAPSPRLVFDLRAGDGVAAAGDTAATAAAAL